MDWILSIQELISSASKIYTLCLGHHFIRDTTTSLDGHGHSTCSDGSYSVNELVEYVSGLHESLVFLTDHNTLNHFYSVANGLFKLDGSSTIIPGSEITCNLNGVRCHVIIVGGNNDGHAFSFFSHIRCNYINRECDRLRRIYIDNGIEFKEEDYLAFCASRTPNWTLTYDYIKQLEENGILGHGHAELIRRGEKYSIEYSECVHSISFEELIDFCNTGGYEVFICHIADLYETLGEDVICDILVNHKHLGVDLSRGNPADHCDISCISSRLKKIVMTRHNLVGTDYHHDLPSPQTYSFEQWNKLEKQLFLCSYMSDWTSDRFFTQKSFYVAELFNNNCELNTQLSFFSDLGTQSVNILSNESGLLACNAISGKSILGVGIVKNVICDSLVEKIRNESQDINEVGTKFLSLCKEAYSHPAITTFEKSAVLGVADIAHRLGFFTIYGALMDKVVNTVPPNFTKAYNFAPSESTLQPIINELWKSLFISAPTIAKNSNLIWRKKRRSSAFSTAVTIYFNNLNTRNGINNVKARRLCDNLISTSNVELEKLSYSYNALIYDHLAATLIIEDLDITYDEVLDLIKFPRSWKVIKSETDPRNSYHKRLWMIIQINNEVNGILNFQFELMIKKRKDFIVGRANCWWHKGIRIGVDRSPWSQNGHFDETTAYTKAEYGIFRNLATEITGLTN